MRAQPDWSDLRLFLEVAREGSFSAAAGKLGIHHTTVARRMEQLEQVLTVRLFDRHARGVRPTLAGEALQTHARAIEEQVMHASMQVAGRDLRLTGSVRLTAPPELVPRLMPALCAFREVAPEVRVVLDVDTAVRDLGRREADLALRAGQDPPQDAIAHPLAPVSWNAWTHPNAPRERWVLYESDVRPAAVQRQLVGAPPAALVVRSVSDAAVAVKAGLGPGVLPHFVVSPELVPLQEPVVDGQLWLLVHVDLRKVARVRALAEHLRSELVRELT